MRYADPQTNRDLASLLKKVSVIDRTLLGTTLRKTFGKPVPPKIIRLDPRVARMSMRLALYAPLEAKCSVIATISDSTDRMFVDVPTDIGRVGILTYRENGVLHVPRIEAVYGRLAMCKLGAELTATEDASDVDWHAISCGQWEIDLGRELFWTIWHDRHLSFRMITAEERSEEDVRSVISDGLMPDMISLALACALPKLVLDDPALQDWAHGPVAGLPTETFTLHVSRVARRAFKAEE